MIIVVYKVLWFQIYFKHNLNLKIQLVKDFILSPLLAKGSTKLLTKAIKCLRLIFSMVDQRYFYNFYYLNIFK